MYNIHLYNTHILMYTHFIKTFLKSYFCVLCVSLQVLKEVLCLKPPPLKVLPRSFTRKLRGELNLPAYCL